MVLTTLELPVDAELRAAYDAASDEDRQKVQLMVNLVMHQMMSPRKRTLSEVMDAISDQAEANGLTPEILEAILNDDDDE